MADELPMFDPESFLDTDFEGALSTSIILPPAQDWPAQVTKLTGRKFPTDDGEKAILEVQWCITDEACKTVTKMDKSFAKQSIWLDFTENGVLDFSEGKNVELGRLRDALGQNKEKGKWSPRMLQDQVATIRVSHRPDKNNSDIVYAEVKRVAAL